LADDRFVPISSVFSSAAPENVLGVPLLESEQKLKFSFGPRGDVQVLAVIP
jgi:hypothetical protein